MTPRIFFLFFLGLKTRINPVVLFSTRGNGVRKSAVVPDTKLCTIRTLSVWNNKVILRVYLPRCVVYLYAFFMGRMQWISHNNEYDRLRCPYSLNSIRRYMDICIMDNDDSYTYVFSPVSRCLSYCVALAPKLESVTSETFSLGFF